MSTVADDLPIIIEREEKQYSTPQRVLIWRKFRKHKLAMFSSVVVLALYIIALFADFFAPFPAEETNSQYIWGPPQALQFSFEEGFYVHGYSSEVDPDSFQRVFAEDPETKIPIHFFVEGYEYKIVGLIPSNIHLIGSADPEQPFYLLGADRVGQDLLSRVIMGTRISMSIGLVGVGLSLIIGILLGGISGYYGGAVDNFIQRMIDFIRSLPTIPLWMGLAAAVPLRWDPLYVYFAITIILSFIGWTGMARVVRGRFLSLKSEEFVTAAKLDGASQFTVIFSYMLPAFTSHIIASITLSIPGMILAETSLSFLGLGLRPPIVSWGVLLKEAQTVRTLATAPWLLVPAVAVIVAVLALNFLGDGLRDAADPYS